MKKIRFLTKRMNEFHWGQFFISKLQWVINIIILLKVFNVSFYWYIITLIFVFFITWVFGYFVVKSGFKLRFLKLYFEGTNIK